MTIALTHRVAVGSRSFDKLQRLLEPHRLELILHRKRSTRNALHPGVCVQARFGPGQHECVSPVLANLWSALDEVFQEELVTRDPLRARMYALTGACMGINAVYICAQRQ